MTWSEFWSATPFQCVFVAQAYGRRVRKADQIARSAAWHTEAFARTKRLPSHGEAIGAADDRPQKPANPVSQVKAWVAAQIAKGNVTYGTHRRT